MIDLIKVFEPVVMPLRPVKMISHMGIDIHGAIWREGKIDLELAAMYKFFERINSVDAHLISTSQKEALKTLMNAKAEPKLLKVHNKDEFYEALEEMGTDAVVIDNEKPKSKRVALYIHPEDPRFRAFLQQRIYAKEPLPQIE